MPKHHLKRDLARPLTPKQAEFVRVYLVLGVARMAALAVGCTRVSADAQASQWLRLPQVRAAVKAGEAAKLDRSLLSADRTLEEVRRIAFSDLRRLENPSTGKILLTVGEFKQLPAEVTATIASVKAMKKNLIAGDGVSEDVVEIKLWDKMKALELLMKHFGLMVDLHADVTQKMIDSMDEGDIRTRIAQILAKIPPAQLGAMREIVKENATLPPSGASR